MIWLEHLDVIIDPCRYVTGQHQYHESFLQCLVCPGNPFYGIFNKGQIRKGLRQAKIFRNIWLHEGRIPAHFLANSRDWDTLKVRIEEIVDALHEALESFSTMFADRRIIKRVKETAESRLEKRKQDLRWRARVIKAIHSDVKKEKETLIEERESLRNERKEYEFEKEKTEAEIAKQKKGYEEASRSLGIRSQLETENQKLKEELQASRQNQEAGSSTACSDLTKAMESPSGLIDTLKSSLSNDNKDPESEKQLEEGNVKLKDKSKKLEIVLPGFQEAQNSPNTSPDPDHAESSASTRSNGHFPRLAHKQMTVSRLVEKETEDSGSNPSTLAKGLMTSHIHHEKAANDWRTDLQQELEGLQCRVGATEALQMADHETVMSILLSVDKCDNSAHQMLKNPSEKH